MIKSSLFQIKETTAMFFSGSERKYRYILPKNQEFLQPLVMDQKVDNLSKSWNYEDIPLENTNNEEEKANKCNQCKFASSLKSSLRRHWKYTVGKSQTNATDVTMHLLRHAFWGDIWKYTVEKSQTNAACVILHPLRQAIWGDIWKYTVEKRSTNATSVIMHPLMHTIWGLIWKHTVETSQTNATSVNMHALIQVR